VTSPALSPDRVLALAATLLAATVGEECPARFYLAGGAFKALLNGQPPRDIDLWAASLDDRARLLDTLVRRGAVPLGPRPFADAFDLNGHVVDVPHRAEPPTLEETLRRFDLALSAIGVEHTPGAPLRELIHPLALCSVEARAVLLLKPLVNWKYALATLERMRRYAEELGYRVPAEEEAEIWAVFDVQTPEMQAGMIERLRTAGRGGYGVEEEARCRGCR
jgi:hypothetical protein